MRRRIDLLDEHHTVTVYGEIGAQRLQVADSDPQCTALAVQGEFRRVIQLGDQSTEIQMAVKGEAAYIRAFDRTFTLRIVDPVEQAAQESGGGGNIARAPMPGMVVAVQVAGGDQVAKGQPMITIESMKILTVITAPRDGEVSQVHFEPGDTFDKNAVLATMSETEEA
ncbi:MAG: acetyl-CoA carboxylase biotin carboxyl carrier protein subunit [Deltaproteobacteria bacterium]|nr:acetyl-CoA carboxylase biotin carboxyl carrier protein subunit [Deltaproteobacteria bacterium]